MADAELPLGRLGGIGATFALGVVVAVGVVLLAFRWGGLPPGGKRLARGYDLVIPGPALQPAPQPDLRAYRAGKQRLLQGRGWVDGEAGIARIPIDDAMALLAAGAMTMPPPGVRVEPATPAARVRAGGGGAAGAAAVAGGAGGQAGATPARAAPADAAAPANPARPAPPAERPTAGAPDLPPAVERRAVPAVDPGLGSAGGTPP